MARVPAIAVADPSRRTLLALGAGLGLAALGARPSHAAVDPADVFADADVPVLGNPKGDVAVAVWFDYQCPFCKKVEPILNEVARKDGKVAILLKDWPIFGDLSTAAARAAWSARRQNRLAALHDRLMAVPKRLDTARLDAEIAAAGLDRARLDTDMAAETAAFDALVARNGAQAEAFGFPGTPAFVIGSFVFPGGLDADGFRQAIADARRKR
ncbi:DsbA family protein [Pinisolibacter aquiterrae]|uniref:DsbA family protein n=1 Tax=Pinisolibacter aquiterrae TaxID=2815579 RepID=UPI001C3E5440|nr:DsbA family protein [Pinisolibacter aquiterrae]MBV5266328.1 DsbA family protein [Pinisolibacter aquiterrae]MCC8236475.1 DsbA family protein [Pinisolibacter aquiterrae]